VERGIHAASPSEFFELLEVPPTPHFAALKRRKRRARALGSERAPEGESPSLVVLPARQLKVTASRQRDVESNWK